ncbi:MAG: carbonic anhydrase [Desulfovibrionales bacterium]|nr:carbonic anhydrase [Desulfovibrionales bacterium]
MRDRTPESALKALQEGNQRFVANDSAHPRSRYEQTIMEEDVDQNRHAIATVVACSDSRVPVERIFDNDIMDTFIVRAAGNVAGVDQTGSVEYGVGVVETPLLVILGHTKCGAVQATLDRLYGKEVPSSPSIDSILNRITPAVEKAVSQKERNVSVLDAAIEYNIWQSLHDLFVQSQMIRERYADGKVKIVAAIYDLHTGVVSWLDEAGVASVYADAVAEVASQK